MIHYLDDEIFTKHKLNEFWITDQLKTCWPGLKHVCLRPIQIDTNSLFRL